MTSLTDKMEKLFRDEHPVDCIDGVTPVETYGYEETYNGAVRDCIALAKAEAATQLDHCDVCNQMTNHQNDKCLKHKAAVVGDWEAEFRLKRHKDYSSMINFDDIIDSEINFIKTLLAAQRAKVCKDFTYSLGQKLRKKSGSEWSGTVVGFYSTELTPEGYAIESDKHKGTVQIYPLAALELIVCEPS